MPKNFWLGTYSVFEMGQIECNERKGEEGNGHNDAYYCDSRLATRVRRGRLLLEGPATVGRSSART